MKALILAGGKGTRLRPITHTLNKQLIPIAGKPLLFRVIQDVVDLGIQEIFVNLNKGDREIPALLGDGSAWGVKFAYIEQEVPNGMMYPVMLAEEQLKNDDFVLIAGDNILSGGLKKYYAEFQKNQSAAHLLVARVSNPHRFGVAVVENGKLRLTVEKPETFISDLAVTGIYFYRKPIFEALHSISPELRGKSKIAEYYPPPAHQWLVNHGHTVTVTEVTGWWKDTGEPEDLLEGNQLILLDMVPQNFAAFIDPQVELQGKVHLEPGVRLLGKTVVRGPVFIGKETVIRDSYIGPFTSIGNSVQMTQSSIERCLVFDHAFISHVPKVVDSIIGNHSVVRERATHYPSGQRLVLGDHSVVEFPSV